VLETAQKIRVRNLVVGRDIEAEDGIGELKFYDVVPEPLHGGTIGDVIRIDCIKM